MKKMSELYVFLERAPKDVRFNALPPVASLFFNPPVVNSSCKLLIGDDAKVHVVDHDRLLAPLDF